MQLALSNTPTIHSYLLYCRFKLCTLEPSQTDIKIMSFLKFWNKKGKDNDDQRKDEATDPELEKRRLRHSLSISRSGRFKQKKRERGQILDKPELFAGQDDVAHPDRTENDAPDNPQSNTSGPHPRSPNTKCRDVNSQRPPENVRMGRSVVT